MSILTHVEDEIVRIEELMARGVEDTLSAVLTIAHRALLFASHPDEAPSPVDHYTLLSHDIASVPASVVSAIAEATPAEPPEEEPPVAPGLTLVDPVTGADVPLPAPSTDSPAITAEVEPAPAPTQPDAELDAQAEVLAPTAPAEADLVP